jgi:hypothetical protein
MRGRVRLRSCRDDGDAARVDLGSKLALNRSTALFASFGASSPMYAGKGGLKVAS